jgi:chromosomal replication initiation ATPase DnaA
MTASASGHIIGNKNHATVLNAVKFIEDNLISDKNLRYNIQQIRNSLNIA